MSENTWTMLTVLAVAFAIGHMSFKFIYKLFKKGIR
jgi:hypothetical protein